MSTPEQSLKTVEEHLKNHPDDASAWNIKGVILATLGEFGPALRALNQAIKLNAQLQEAYANKGRVLLALGPDNATEALKAFDKALHLKPSDYGTLKDKVFALRALGRLTEEKKCLETLVQEMSDDWKAWMRIGNIQLEQGDFKQADGSFGKVLDIEPNHAGAMVHRAIAMSMMEKWSSAIKIAKRACDVAPNDVEVWRVLGDINIRAGKYRAALKALKRASKINPEDAQVELLMGIVEYRSGQLREAIKHFKRATIRDRKSHRAYRNMALVSMEMEDWQTAMNAWERFIRLVNNDAEAYDALATVCARIDDFCAASEAWEKARKLFKKRNDTDNASRVTELGRAARINCSRQKKAEKARREHEKATRSFSDRHRLRGKKKKR